MTESFVTQCPHCQTRFRVTTAQLGIAGGAVRCGACLLVFNAARQLAAARGDEASQDILPPQDRAQEAAPVAQPQPQQAATPASSESPFPGQTVTDAPPARPASLSASSDYSPPLQVFRPDTGNFRPEASPQAATRQTRPQSPPPAATAPSKPKAARRAPAADWDKVELNLEQINAALASMGDDHRPQPVRPPQAKKPAAAAASPQPQNAAPAQAKPPTSTAAQPPAAQPSSTEQATRASLAAQAARANAAVLAAAEATAQRQAAAAPASAPQPVAAPAEAAPSPVPAAAVSEPASDTAETRTPPAAETIATPDAAQPAAEAASVSNAALDNPGSEAAGESAETVAADEAAQPARAAGDEPDSTDSDLHASKDDDEAAIPAVTNLRASKHEADSELELNPIRDSLVSLSAEPLQLEWPERRNGSLLRGTLWTLLCLLPVGGLAGQYVWFNYDYLARSPQWRPWFEQACPVIGCELPSRVDINQIRSSNLTVRNHPTQPGALKIDAIIYNRADFAQPFPLIELRFEDMNELVLAQRSFRPAEYLGGELAGSLEMPPQTPIHIALEIVDPGTQASNYGLAFHSPE